MAPSRRNRQLGGSSMLLNGPRRPGRFQASRPRTNPQDEATRIAASTQLAEDFGMLPPRDIRPTHIPTPADNDEQNNLDFDQHHTGDQEAYQPAIAHARYHRLQQYAAIRQQRSEEWQQLVNQATATYLFCQQSSHNWTSVKFPECVPYNCTCPPGAIHHRSVDLIGLPEQYVAFQIPFCKCTSDVIRLLHYGFLASLAKKPQTAFSVGLIQFHDALWQASAISTASFIKGLSTFLDSQHQQPIQLRVPFSHSKDLYKPDFILAMDSNYQQRHYAHAHHNASKDSPLDNQYPPIFLRPSEISSSTTLCEETEVHVASIDDPCAKSQKVAEDTRDATTWEKCDDSGIFGSACRHNVPLLYANIFKTGEKLYYPVSVLRRLFANFPESKIGILYDIGCQLETHIKKLPILNDPNRGNYTNEFFQCQWDNEQAYHWETNGSFREKQEKELGRLLRMEDQLEAEWSENTKNVAEAIQRAQMASTLSQEIVAQRMKVGNAVFLLNLTKTQRDDLLKIWHTKTEMRQRFLDLVLEKGPLTQVSRPGEQSSLGTRMQQKILEAIQKRAKQLNKVLNKYNKRVRGFAQSFPDQPHPQEINYTQLMQLESKDSFWNNGLFTNQNEPWAVNPNTQKGIRILASLNCGLEEKRRIGWEVQRAMKWVIQEHNDLKSLIAEFSGPIQPNKKFSVLTKHPILQLLTLERRILACKALVHSKFIRICHLQIIWNEHFLQVLADTTHQLDNKTIRSQWSFQMSTLALDVSQIPGDNDNLLAALEDRLPEPVPQERHPVDPVPQDDGENDDDDDTMDENTYLNDVEEMVHENMIEELANDVTTMDDV
ncbi:hypothetical protein PTTG_25140 [Puccinia triticina 1-1 BBBD Race 1]|uniref:CxC1 domain-containing protein n=1 Tax=Puccinia triticina (isolate 1-1 / race 1 (BBBD)) TaxID=630390 RepID=A0A180H5D5_PUCT1|nr:hypothetical protein PTTG_25140 [Puccinia triticina 1-1 BBBD Race 1]